LKEDDFQGTLITEDVHIDFIPLDIFGFVYDFISFVMFCFGFLFAMGFFPNAVVGPWGVLVMYLKSYQGFNKKNLPVRSGEFVSPVYLGVGKVGVCVFLLPRFAPTFLRRK